MQLPRRTSYLFLQFTQEMACKIYFCELHFRATIKSFVYRTNIFFCCRKCGCYRKIVFSSFTLVHRHVSQNIERWFLFLQIDATKLFSLLLTNYKTIKLMTTEKFAIQRCLAMEKIAQIFHAEKNTSWTRLFNYSSHLQYGFIFCLSIGCCSLSLSLLYISITSFTDTTIYYILIIKLLFISTFFLFIFMYACTSAYFSIKLCTCALLYFLQCLYNTSTIV